MKPPLPIRSCFVVISVVLVAFGIGCERDVELPEGDIVYADDFDDGIDDAWTTGYDGWHIDDGKLRVQGARNDALWLQRPLPENFRVSFTARSDSEEGDIKFEILGDGKTHESGYVGIFGGWDNSLNIIARLDEHGDDRLVGAPDQRVQPGQTYEMDVIRTDNRLRWYVDEKPFLTYDDPDPLTGENHRYFAFNNWETPLVFDEFRVYDLDAE